MYSLRLESGEKIAGIQYKPSVGSHIRIDKKDEWYRVTRLVGRIAYSKKEAPICTK